MQRHSGSVVAAFRRFECALLCWRRLRLYAAPVCLLIILCCTIDDVGHLCDPAAGALRRWVPPGAHVAHNSGQPLHPRCRAAPTRRAIALCPSTTETGGRHLGALVGGRGGVRRDDRRTAAKAAGSGLGASGRSAAGGGAAASTAHVPGGGPVCMRFQQRAGGRGGPVGGRGRRGVGGGCMQEGGRAPRLATERREAGGASLFPSQLHGIAPPAAPHQSLPSTPDRAAALRSNFGRAATARPTSIKSGDGRRSTRRQPVRRQLLALSWRRRCSRTGAPSWTTAWVGRSPRQRRYWSCAHRRRQRSCCARRWEESTRHRRQAAWPRSGWVVRRLAPLPTGPRCPGRWCWAAGRRLRGRCCSSRGCCELRMAYDESSVLL